MDENTLQQLARIRGALAEHREFLRTYLTSADDDTQPAEDERIKDVLALANELSGVLSELAEESATNPADAAEENAEAEGVDEALAAADEAINLEYRTHVLGTPDGEDNIEGDWTMDGDVPAAEEPAEQVPAEKAEAAANAEEQEAAEEPETPEEQEAAEKPEAPAEEAEPEEPKKKAGKKKGKKHKKGKKGKKGKK